MNHKRGKPKSSRAGCLLCHPNKLQRAKKVPRSKRALAIDRYLDEVGEAPRPLRNRALGDGLVAWLRKAG